MWLNTATCQSSVTYALGRRICSLILALRSVAVRQTTLRKEWENISQELFNNLVSYMPAQCQVMFGVQVDNISY